MSELKRTIARTETRCHNLSHRADFKTCPHCGKKFDTKVWDKQATILVLAIVHGKHGSVAVVSECPACFETSWVHHDGGCFKYGFGVSYDDDDDGKKRDPWMMKWAEAVEQEMDRRHLSASRAWGAGICWRCANLEEPQITTHAWRKCPIGTGPAVSACPKFKEIKRLPQLPSYDE